MTDLFAWLFSVFLLIGVLGLLCYQLVSLSDLEVDHIDAYVLASRIKEVIIPEFVIVGFISFLHLVTGHCLLFFCCTPYLYYNYRLYTTRRHLIDVTEVFNHMRWEIKLRFYKILYLVLMLSVSIFWMIRSCIINQNQAIKYDY